MGRSTSSRDRTSRRHGQQAILLLLASLLLLAPGCGEEEDAAAAAAAREEEALRNDPVREISFAVSSATNDAGACDDRFEFGAPVSSVLAPPLPPGSDPVMAWRSYSGSAVLGSGDWSEREADVPMGRVPARVGVGRFVCVSAWQATPLEEAFREGMICKQIAWDTEALTYSFEWTGERCHHWIDVDVSLDRFRPEEFCRAACDDYLSCGTPHDTCVEDCVAGVTMHDVTEETGCYDLARMYTECNLSTSCLLDPIIQCDEFWNPSCAEPVLPPDRDPRPIQCDPRQEDLVSGREGDFAVIGKTYEAPNEYFLVLDLTQLDEVLAAIDVDPGNPALAVAGAVTTALFALDGSSYDSCALPWRLSYRFTQSPPPDFGQVDAQLRSMQARIEELAYLADSAKNAAIDFVFDQFFCPTTVQVFGGGFPGWTAAALFGCYQD